MPTLEEKFELAQSYEKNWEYAKASYHCRKILDMEARIDVESLLGTVLAKMARIEEASLLLGSALTNFILGLHPANDTCVSTHSWLIYPIDTLLGELVRQRNDEQDWHGLVSSFQQIFAVPMGSNAGNSTEAADQLFTHLLVLGLSFAHEFSMVGQFEAAMFMYQNLLYHSLPQHSDISIPANEKVRAHSRYALLAKQDENWILSAQELHVACNTMLLANAYDGHQAVESNIHELLPVLTCEEGQELKGILLRKLNEIWVRILPGRLSRITEFLPSDLPMRFERPKPLTTTQASVLNLSLGTTESGHRSGDRTSTTGLSGIGSTRDSNKYGETGPDSVCTGISDPIGAYVDC